MSARGTTMSYPSLPPRTTGPWLVTIHRGNRVVTFSKLSSRAAAERLCARLLSRGLVASVTRPAP